MTAHRARLASLILVAGFGSALLTAPLLRPAMPAAAQDWSVHLAPTDVGQTGGGAEHLPRQTRIDINRSN